MALKTYQTINNKQTSANEPVIGKNQVLNNTDGYVFQINNWKKLERFLVLGTEGGTYYVGEKKLTRDNCETVIKLIGIDGKRVVDTVIAISDAGRSSDNDPALFTLALCVSLGDLETRKYAITNLDKVARIGTHLFHFAQFVSQFRGWGKLLRKGIANWYLNKDIDKLVFQLLKYQQRDGWSHKDLIRLTHPKTTNEQMNKVFNWLVNDKPFENELINVVDSLKMETNPTTVVEAIKKFRLPMEMVPNNLFSHPEVASNLLHSVGVTALIRNLGNFSKWNVMTNENIDHIKSVLLNQDTLKKARIHPIQILTAMHIYTSGHGSKGSGEWEVNHKVSDILDKAFYLSFGAIEPTNKRILISLDVSGSMDWSESKIGKLAGMTAREASACMALVTMAVEKNCDVVGFSDTLKVLDISPRRRLDDVVSYIRTIGAYSTNCSLPVTESLKNKKSYDVFIFYTDNEFNTGNIHPFQAMQKYRKEMNIPDAKMISVGMVATGFTIADPSDPYMLDVVGFDTNTPQMMSEFIQGKI